jgi:alpha-glucosidase
MRTTDPTRVEDVHDPIGKLGWPKEKGRDGERTPMQWDFSNEAGFTTATKPWLPIPPSANKYNVDAESKDPDSIFNAYKRLIALRKTEPALRDGVQVSIGNDPDVFTYLRTAGDETVLVLLNMSDRERTISFKPDELPGSKLTLLYRSTPAPTSIAPAHVVLAPFVALVAKVQ